MLLRMTLLIAVFAALGAAPASAQQPPPPSLAQLKPCYVAATEEQREFVLVDGSGFTPFALIDVFVDDILQASDPPPQAAFDGSLKGSVRAPFIEEGQRQFTLRATEHDNPVNSAIRGAKVTRLSVEQRPESAATRERVRFRGRGFTTPAPIYAHYVFAGKSRKTVEIGMPTGDCGLFSVRRRQFPFKKSPRVGVWTIQFDQVEKYDPKASPRVPLTIKVRKTIKPPPAQAR
jgi:hypothetical protein